MSITLHNHPPRRSGRRPDRARRREAAGPPALYDNALKRLVDVVGASALLLLFGPLMILLWLLVRRDGGPGIYRQPRLGAEGVPFDCLKFRSMCVDSEAALQRQLARDPAAAEEWRRTHKLRNDPRVTRIGRFLRRSSLDELPQILNVLRGDMSLVGPRPIVAAEVARYGRYFTSYRSCRPGITGLWQVSGRSDTRYRRRVALDHAYRRKWRLLLDARIILATPMVMIRGSGAY
ncbi:sugar transferase [Azospirillum agricola]|uniref:sugar transferase n=1 Tax=Azospirillum agricola TaxID=1720247 RepID=UPI000A0F3077|nr:sugar transferase [Azospirillum agricola]SMH47418.1 Sugar transferase involved in LPS biosynthesis (colanic, teichoic acid) [Azospirillum lipoferum]